MTDRELAGAVGSGDPAAFLEFVRLHHHSIYRYLKGLSISREDVEDLTIETMHLARRKIAGYRGEASLRTWVHRVAYRCFTHWNRRRRPTEPLTEELFLSSADPYASIHEADALLAAIARLPDPMRQAFVLHEVNELPIEDIAHVLEIPVGTVKSRLFHARTKLRELLTAPEEETHVLLVPKPRPAN